MPRRHLERIGISGRRPPALDADGSAPRGYPRPTFRRAGWTSLDGRWSFALNPEAKHHRPEEVRFDHTIEVPFSPETARSGIADTGLYRACWYERELTAPPLTPHEQLLLHFGAVDYECDVWLDGQLVGGHEGGYTPFTLDATALTKPGSRHRLVVRAGDNPHNLAKPRGKQDWRLDPH